jgi:DNA ligase D-like protein (predicted polymerase)/DNA ligase D-like protein (predicted 3'-phosphoesterase)
MALTKYKEKRNFKESPEPTGGSPDSEHLRFVIQKHDASRLHYDFRLEMEGVLKSWAVPKGPSTDPDIKRLAIMVEDHPYDYINFEGIIPSGYGAGTVMVWDEGFYEPADAKGNDKIAQDEELQNGIPAGKLHVVLHGKKLKGEYALVKTHGRGENSWLLFKVKDKYVSKEDITLKNKSVISKKTLAQIEKTTTNFYNAKRVKGSSSKSKKEASLNKRSDVKAASAKNKKEKENIITPDEILAKTKTAKAETILKPAGKKDRKTFLNPTEKTQVRKINGHEIKFTNLNKVYWPDENITKRDMLNYYYQVAPYILPYLKDRPQSMNRHPDGINGKSFYFKNVRGTAPEWVETFDYKSDAVNRLRKYLVAKNEASLLYMANLGCIEMNPWHSKVDKEDYPDWCIIDLDPAENTFNQVIEAANVTKNILESMGVTSYPKTSGSTGIHVYIPMGAKYTYEQSKEFARIIATLVQREIPEFTSIERTVNSRKGKIYIDFLQNRSHATLAAPYSLRPKPGATVSMPLQWEEVKKGLKMSDFNIYNAIERIKSAGDIFKPVLGRGINLEKVVKNFNKE